jgi:hypothetical protein
MTHVPGINNSPSSSIRAEELAKRQPVSGNPNIITGPAYVSPRGVENVQGPQFGQPGVIGAQSTYVPVNPNVQNIETGRISTEEGELRRKTGPWEYSGTRKQSSLIVFRDFMFVFFTAFVYGSMMGTESNPIAVSIGIATLIPFVILLTLDSLMLYYAGLELKKIMIWLVLEGLLFLGMFAAVKGICAAGLQATAFMFAVSVGGYLYFIAIHMMPALMKERDGRLKSGFVLLFVLGAALMFALRAIQ